MSNFYIAGKKCRDCGGDVIHGDLPYSHVAYKLRCNNKHCINDGGVIMAGDEKDYPDWVIPVIKDKEPKSMIDEVIRDEDLITFDILNKAAEKDES